MFRNKKYKILAGVLLITSLLSGCAGEATENPAVQTAVALTIAAQNATPAEIPTETPDPNALPFPTKTAVSFIPTLTPSAPTADPQASPTLLGAGPTASKEGCNQAEFISQSLPDEKIFKPGEKFTQTWEIKNTSNCTWTQDYRIIFFDGDVMGGSYYYNMPQIVPPQTVVPISLLLTAPTANGSYVSKWKFQAPDKTYFGVGQYQQPFFYEIEVNSSNNIFYNVTDMKLDIVREPATGCPANVWHYANATITTNGPLKFEYRWEQSDNNNSKFFPAEIKQAGSLVLTRSWSMHLGSTPGTKWFRIIVKVDEEEKTGPTASFIYDCGS